jgi:hypothetical protein
MDKDERGGKAKPLCSYAVTKMNTEPTFYKICNHTFVPTLNAPITKKCTAAERRGLSTSDWPTDGCGSVSSTEIAFSKAKQD